MNIQLEHFKDKDKALAWAFKELIAYLEWELNEYKHEMDQYDLGASEKRLHDIKQIQQIIWVDQDETL